MAIADFGVVGNDEFLVRAECDAAAERDRVASRDFAADREFPADHLDSAAISERAELIRRQPRRDASEPAALPPSTALPPAMHRIRTVRLQQGVSLRTAARHTGTDVRQLRLQEQEAADLRLSDLHKWQKALDVPLAELLVEPTEELSGPIKERAQMVKVMKTAAAMLERAPTPGMKRMAQMLVEQLVEIMPELAEVSPWHNFGQRRSLDEYGVIVSRTLSTEQLHGSSLDD